jgi:multiple antibiotic resistance protein
MTASFFVAFATFFATVGVADIAFIFAGLTRNYTARQRFVAATRGVLVATGILLFFSFVGNLILEVFGITLPALRVAGGILLLLIAIDMVLPATPAEREPPPRKRPRA